ncbi:MAG: hypothetical protein RLZZ618_3025 [Pseudomonadota bacterium]|jgi:hypothetical protein
MRRLHLRMTLVVRCGSAGAIQYPEASTVALDSGEVVVRGEGQV